MIDRDLYWVKDGEEDRINRTGNGSWRKHTKGGRRLVVTGDKETAEHHHRYKYYEGTWVTSVFKLMSRMQTWMQVLIAACILSMVSSVPTLVMREQRPSKYKAQMFDPAGKD